MPGHGPEGVDLLPDELVRELSAHLHPIADVQLCGPEQHGARTDDAFWGAIHPLSTVRDHEAFDAPSRLLKGVVANVNFTDAQRPVEALGFEELRVTGSHHIYGRAGMPEQLNLQDRGGQTKPYQLRQLVTWSGGTI